MGKKLSFDSIFLSFLIIIFYSFISLSAQSEELPSGIRKSKIPDTTNLSKSINLLPGMMMDNYYVFMDVTSSFDSTVLFSYKNLASAKQFLSYKFRNNQYFKTTKITYFPLNKTKLSAEEYFGTIMRNNLRFYGKHEVRPVDQGVRIPLGDIYNFFKGIFGK